MECVGDPLSNKMNPTLVPEPKAHGYLLVFDVETTGLPPKKTKSSDWTGWPYITQLTAVLYHSETGRVQAHLNHYISLPKDVVVPPIVAQLTGITTELCQTKGHPISSVICSFYELFCRADYVVAHNLAFDKSMLRCEIERNADILPPFCQSLFMDESPKQLCTMLQYQYYCGIRAVSAKGWNYTKLPRLSEVYDRLFQGRGQVAADYQLHNSVVDTLLCLRCLLLLECRQEISEDVFVSLINTFSQPAERPLYSVSFRTRKHTAEQSRMILC